jgi:hypothetical protein
MCIGASYLEPAYLAESSFVMQVEPCMRIWRACFTKKARAGINGFGLDLVHLEETIICMDKACHRVVSRHIVYNGHPCAVGSDCQMTCCRACQLGLMKSAAASLCLTFITFLVGTTTASNC